MATTTPARAGKPVNFWIPEALQSALNAYLQSLRPRPTMTAFACVAFEEFLRQKGFWPQQKRVQG